MKCGESIDDDEIYQRWAVSVKMAAHEASRNPLATEDGGKHDTNRDGFENFSRTDATQIDAHQYGNRHRHGDSKRSPGADLSALTTISAWR
jgi:hypothetical protein